MSDIKKDIKNDLEILRKIKTCDDDLFELNYDYKKYKKDKLLSIVVAGEKNSLHPIAIAICEHYGKNSKLKCFNFREISGKGIEYEIGEKKYFVGRSQGKTGSTIVDVYENDILIGKIYLNDKVKPEAKESIFTLKNLGIETMMLSGDNEGIVKSVSKNLGIDSYASGLLPEEKFKIINEEKNKGHTTAFVGDGLNDAPALTLSDVGISMGIMGSQATIETSDVVIANDNLKQIPRLIKISRKTKRIALGNIIFAGVTKLLFLVLGTLGVTGMAFAVFADVGVTLLAILNSLRVLMFKLKD